MKWILRTLAVLLLAASVSADTLYTCATGGFVAEGGAISPRARRVELLSSGTVGTLWDESPGSSGMSLFLATNYGGTITSVTDFPNLDYQDNSTLFSSGDTLWVVPSYLNSTYDIWIREYRGSTLFAVDTLGSDAAGSGDRIGIAPVGGQWLWWHDVEAGTPDSTKMFLSDGDIGSITTMTQKGPNSTLISNGVRLMTRGIKSVGGGVLAWDNSGEDIRWGDTNGVAALALDVTGGVDLNIAGYAYGKLFTYGDSNLAFVFQNYANDQAGLWVRAGHATSGATGSPTGVSWHAGTQTLIASGSLRDTFPMCAQVVYLRRDPDSMWVFGRYPDNDSVDIVRWFSGDGGATWTGPVTRREGHTQASRKYNFQMAQYANVDDTCIWFAGTYSDSVASGSEAAYIWIDTIRLGAGGPDPGGTRAPRMTGILIGSADNFMPDAHFWTVQNEFMIKEGE